MLEALPNNPRVYGYLASEKKKTAQANKHLQAQRVAVVAWASSLKIGITEFVAEYDFAPDQHFKNRVESRKLLAMLQPGDTVVAAKFDRLFGAPEDAHATLTLASERGVHFRALDVGNGKPNLEQSRSLFEVLLAVSDAYSDYPKKIAARRVKKREADAGRYRGGHREFGNTPAEREHIAALQKMQRAGASFRDLERASKQAGFPLSHAGIRKILDRLSPATSDQN